MNAADQRRLLGAVTFCVVIAFLLPSALPIPFAAWNRQAGDALLQLRNRCIPPAVDSRLVLMLLDDRTTAAFPSRMAERAFMAQFLDTLRLFKPDGIVLDLLFTPLQGSTADGHLGRSLAHAGTVAALALVPEGMSRSAAPLPAGTVAPLPEQCNGLRQGVGMIPLAPLFNEKPIALGQINAFPDDDGLFRRYPLVMRAGDGWVPSLALRTVAQQLGVPLKEIQIGSNTIILPGKGDRADLAIPVNRRGELLLNFPGTWETTFPRYAVEKVAAEAATPAGQAALREELQNSIILIADSSTVGRDSGPIPGDPASPLVLLHATAINDMLTGHFLRQPSLVFTFAEPLLLIGILYLCARRLSGGRLALACSMLALGWLAGVTALLVLKGLVVPFVPSQLAIVFSLATVQRLQFMTLHRERQRLHDRFACYFPPAVLQKIIAAPELLHSFERKQLTILFCDIIGFTSWCEHRDAEEVRSFLNRWYGELSTAIFNHGGTVGKFTGDGLLAYFGDPLPQDDHACRAVAAAFEIQNAAESVAIHWQGADAYSRDVMLVQSAFQVRVGIHTGEVVVGNLGSESLMEYTVIGTAVNLASRLEGKAPPGGILVSATVYAAAGSHYRFTPQGKVALKGANEPMEVYLVQGASSSAI